MTNRLGEPFFFLHLFFLCGHVSCCCGVRDPVKSLAGFGTLPSHQSVTFRLHDKDTHQQPRSQCNYYQSRTCLLYRIKRELEFLMRRFFSFLLKREELLFFFIFRGHFFFRGHASFSCGIYCGVLRMAGRGMRRNNQEKARICLDSLYCHFFYWLLL